MKTLKKFQKSVIICFIAVLVMMTFSTCQKDDDEDNKTVTETTVSGEYEFNISPLVSFNDTTHIHGFSAGDYPEYISTITDVYLYEDESQNIKGETFGYKISGTRNDHNVHLDLYVYPDGGYDEFGYLKGTGSYSEYPTFPDIIYNTYSVQVRKIRDITISYKDTKGWSDKLCKLISKFDSFLISAITDEVFRPMYGCYGHKDGGGYYVFGHEGPGNRLPIYTATVYFPLEWSWCKVRKYGFWFNLKGEVHSVTKLKEEIEKLDHELHIIEKWGFNDGAEYFDHMDDFIQNFGGFAISILYDSHTDNVGLMVNHESGSNRAAASHPFITTLAHKLNHLCGTVYIDTGKDIHSHWHLRRSDLLVCNSPVFIIYLVGTHKVSYN